MVGRIWNKTRIIVETNSVWASGDVSVGSDSGSCLGGDDSVRRNDMGAVETVCRP